MSPFELIQTDVFGRLLADVDLEDVPIILARPRSAEEALEITTKIDQALAGLVGGDRKPGATIIVQMPSGRVPAPEIPGPRLDVEVTLLVLENPMVNMSPTGTRLSAEEIGLLLVNRLHQTFWQEFGCTLVAASEALEPYTDEGGRLGYTVRLTMPLGLTRPAKVAFPQISGAASAVALQTVTSGAEMWFTTDGSYPSEYSQNAQVYRAPFAITAGTLVRAVAMKDGHLQSDVASKQF